MTRKDGGTAFPMQDPQAIHAYAQAATEAAKHDNVEDLEQTYIAARAEAVSGMSLRDYFAAKAMAPLLDGKGKIEIAMGAAEGFAEACYLIADAMLLARSA